MAKLILVTAMTPNTSRRGQNNNTNWFRLALSKLGKKAIVCLREPSLGSGFGIKEALLAAVIARLCHGGY